jgi:hypothetical protein
MFDGQLYSRALRRTAHYMDRRPGILIFGQGARSNAAQEKLMTLHGAIAVHLWRIFLPDRLSCLDSAIGNFDRLALASVGESV